VARQTKEKKILDIYYLFANLAQEVSGKTQGAYFLSADSRPVVRVARATNE
jgi:hypothetical protein